MPEWEKYCIYEDIITYVIGFHGYDKSVVEKLLKSNTPAFELSKNAYEWLCWHRWLKRQNFDPSRHHSRYHRRN